MVNSVTVLDGKEGREKEIAMQWEESIPEDSQINVQGKNSVLKSNEEEEDSICKRTRARYSLESFTLDDLEAFLQETDDDEEEDIPNVDDDDEYRKFLAAVLQSGCDDGEVQLIQSGNNDDDDDEEDNDLDFGIELEEALETDDDEESIPEQASRLLRPLVPTLPIASSPTRRILLPVTEAAVSSEVSPMINNGFFTQAQMGELHCLIHDHLQLLIQVYSLCALDHSRQHIGTQVHGLLSELLQSHVLVTGLDFVDLARKYIVDVSSFVQDYQAKSGFDALSVPLFPILPHQEEVGGEIVNKQQSKKTLAATLVESAKKQSVALVHKDIADLAKRFLPLFKVSLFPRKAPPSAVANRTLFTDAEDELLALGIMEYNSNWKAIKQRFLPCKGEHQIYVRQKNQRSSKASENPIKAVLRMKNSPLTPQEIVGIQEGLKYFKLDWMSVWKFVVPYRDPSSLPRQWRTALGIQKSYKRDAAEKEKRRLHDTKRRERTSKANENHVGDELVDNSTEAYLHEGFLAECRPRAPIIMRPCRRPRKLYNNSVVRLAPDLPPVNLPDSVRVISKSDFAKNQSETSSKTYLIKSGMSDPSGLRQINHSADQNSSFNEHEAELGDDCFHPLLRRTENETSNRNVGSVVAGSTDDIGRCIDEMSDQFNVGIVTENEELSDSDEEMIEEEEEEHVEFECEEMDDSEGEEEEGSKCYQII